MRGSNPRYTRRKYPPCYVGSETSLKTFVRCLQRRALFVVYRPHLSAVWDKYSTK